MQIRRVFLSAGEPSGDVVAARLIHELRRHDPHIDVVGVGGPRMAEAGARIANTTHHIGVVGVTEVVRTLPSVVGACRAIHRSLAHAVPDVAVLIGNDVFNVLLARWLRARGIPTVSYFPPQVWMWRAFAGPFARSFDAIATSFPEEHEVYANANSRAAVSFVGHYLAHELRPAGEDDRLAVRSALGLPRGPRVVGLLPGSRPNEVNSLGPALIGAAVQLAAADPELRFLVAPSDEAGGRAIAAMVARAPGARIAMVPDSHAVMRSADLLLAASGTACLEAALFATPMIIVYKISRLSNLIARAGISLDLLRAYEIGIPNLLLGRSIVPEVLQEHATPVEIANAARNLLSNADRLQQMRIDLTEIGRHLRGTDPIAHVAAIVIERCQQGRGRVKSTAPSRPVMTSPAGATEQE